MTNILFHAVVLGSVTGYLYVIYLQGSSYSYQYEYLKQLLLKEKSSRYRSGYLLADELKFLNILEKSAHKHTPGTKPAHDPYLHQAYHAAATQFNQRRKLHKRNIRGR